ncbi:MAG: trypsin-like serine peptidase [Thermoleophilaceae bacterium]
MSRFRLATLLLVACATGATEQTRGRSRDRLRELLPTDSVIQPIRFQPEWADRSGPGIYWRWTSPANVHAPYYALHFAGFRDDSGAAWRLRIENPNGVELLSFGPSDHRSGDFWTEDLHADRLVFVIESDRKPTGLTFTIDRWLIADPKPAVRSILVPGDSKIEPIGKYGNVDSVWRPSRAIAKLSIKDGAKRYSCSGFLIGENHLLTNEHCMPAGIAVRTPGSCSEAIEVLFNYDGDGAQPSPCLCTEVLEKNTGLDYAVLRLAGEPGKSWGVLRLETTRLPRGGLAEPLRVIQHPGGRPKAVAIQRCRTDRVGVPGIEDGGVDQDFEHTCDTEGGSSGSPVLDGSGRVIGLHHFGFTEDAAVRRNQAVLMQRVVASFPNDLKAELVP